MSDQARVCWISGNIKHRNELFEEIKSSLGEYDLFNIDSTSSIVDLESAILTDDCFSEKRIVEIKSFPKSTLSRSVYVNGIKKLLGNVPAECLVVINGISPSKEKAFHNHVTKMGKIFGFPETVSISNVPQEISQNLEVRSRTIEEEALQVISDSLATSSSGHVDIDCINLAMDKLCLYIGKRRKVTEADACAMFPPNNRCTVWELFGAIDNKDYCAAMRLRSKILVFEHNGDEVGLAISILNIFAWRYKIMVFVKEALATGRSHDAVKVQALKLLKLSFDSQQLMMVAKEENKSAYSEAVVDMMLVSGMRRSPLEGYERRRLLRIIDFTNDCLAILREDATPAKCGLMIDMLLQVSCEEMTIDRKELLFSIFEKVA